MKTNRILVASIVLTLSSYASTSSADWGTMLEDFKNASKILLSGSEDSSSSALTNDTIISGLKEALDIGSRYAIDNVSQPDGYLTNKLIKIAMPPELQQASDLMRKFGLSQLADDFETSINRAAENAAPHATAIIVDAIKNMTIEDATNILNGPDDAATQYFKQTTSQQLTDLFKPSIETSLNQVGSTKYYNDLTDQIAAVPVVGKSINTDLPGYVTQEALNGLFTMIAAEEKKIRDNPAARTTDLLKKVFSN
jgi:hypothetical protein